MISKLLRWVRVIKPGEDDPTKFHVQQIEYMGKISNALMVFPYGVHANIPENAFGVMFTVQGNQDNRGVIAWVPKGRPQLKGGEVAFYHPPTDAFMIWRENGDLDIETGTSGTGNININATLTTINGDLTVTGDTLLGDIVKSQGTDISHTHTHSQDADDGGDGEEETNPPS